MSVDSEEADFIGFLPAISGIKLSLAIIEPLIAAILSPVNNSSG